MDFDVHYSKKKGELTSPSKSAGTPGNVSRAHSLWSSPKLLKAFWQSFTMECWLDGETKQRIKRKSMVKLVVFWTLQTFLTDVDSLDGSLKPRPSDGFAAEPTALLKSKYLQSILM